MKKFTCFLFVSFLLSDALLAQTSITPNVGYRTQTLTTTITNPFFYLSVGSAPQSSSDIWLQRSFTYIYANSYSIINNTTIHANFTIPPNVATGAYDLVLADNSYMFDYLYNGFTVLGSTISGNVYNDINSNGVQDASEANLPGKQIQIQPGNHIVYTDINGNYSIELTPGSYTAQFVPDTTWILTSSPAIYNINLAPSSSAGNNFGIHAPNGWYGVTTFLGCEAQPRCNEQRDYTVVIHNIGTNVQNGTVEFTKPSILSFVSANPTPASVVGDLYTWNYTNLQPNEYMSFVIRLGIPSAPHVHISSHAFTTATDLSSNVVDTAGAYLNQEIICSWDPNDKIVDPTGDTTTVQHYTDINAELLYTIHFQNTGNDTAFSVNLYDTLDVSFDLSTFVFAGSSHLVQTYLEPNRVVRFYFPNINLPDSNVSEVNSHGFVAFRIRPTFGLPDFTVVNNHAGIVFDQNPAIVTNNVYNTLISFPTGTQDNALQEGEIALFPNPITHESLLTINQKGKHSYALKIYDATGKLVKMATLPSNGYMLKKKDFAQGIYLYQVREINGSLNKSGKFVIE